MAMKSEMPSTAEIAAMPAQSQGKQAVDSVTGTYKPDTEPMGFTPVEDKSPFAKLKGA